MNNRIKHIYLLLIIILGIVSLSIYSTYSIFTLEAESSDIVSIHTPTNLNVLYSSYEYKQVEVSKNSYINTDIDIYNNLDDELCYSIWYKIANNNVDQTKVKVYQHSDMGLFTSSTISAGTSRRINVVIINDNDENVRVNIGLAYSKNEGKCELNISEDKKTISSSVNKIDNLSEYLVKEVKVRNNDAGYLTYKDKSEEIKFAKEDKIFVSKEFDYKDELFTLKDSKEITSKEINEYQDYYTCLDKDNCRFLYHITEVAEDNKEVIDNAEIKYYKISKYDYLVGYLSSEIGLRKVSNNNVDNYYYYGDNPDNYIYYNCKNEIDSNSCELWRIIGFFYDKEENKYITKIVRNDYLDKLQFAENTNRWEGSNISKYFNEYKLNNNNLLKEITFKEENILDLESNINNIGLLDKDNKNVISLLNLSDYLYASSCKKDKINEYDETCLNNDWLNKNSDLSEWTMTTKYEEKSIDEETEEEIIPKNDTVYSVDNMIKLSSVSDKLYIRPVVYLKSRALIIDGDGTFDNPFIVR